MEPLLLRYVPDFLETQEMCEKAIENGFRGLYYIPDHFKTQRMCEKVATFNPYTLTILKPKGCMKGPSKMSQKP